SRREQQLVERVARSAVVRHCLVVEVERPRPPPEVELHARVAGLAPHALERFPFPESLRERGPGVGRIRVVADQRDGRPGVELPDAADGGVGGHSSSDDQVPRAHPVLLARFEGPPLPRRSKNCSWSLSSESVPRTAVVRVVTPGLATPRISMQRWRASTETMTP